MRTGLAFEFLTRHEFHNKMVFFNARSMPANFGQDKVPFLYAQPSATLVPGITAPKIENATSVDFDQWPKSLREIATRLGAAAGETSKARQ
jgi:hypothetical protein